MKPYYEDAKAGVVIYHGDSSRVLPRSAEVDAVVTDPPYGVSLAGKRTKRPGSLSNHGYLSTDDSPEIIESVCVPVIKECIKCYDRVVVMPGTRNLFKYPEPSEVGCVFNPAGAGFGRWGFICFQPVLYYGSCPYLEAGMGQRPNGFSDIAGGGDGGIKHPCPKPVRWMRWLVTKASLPGQTILDPFMGSGTTLVAAKLEGRRAIGIEIEERYCEIAANRLRQEVLF